MKVIYIAGPYRAKTPFDIEQNVRRAEEWSLNVARAGGVPLCPHTMNRFFYEAEGLTEDFVMSGCLALLERCNGALFIPGWEASEGARTEHRRAVALGIPCLELGRVAAPRVSPALIGFIRSIEGE